MKTLSENKLRKSGNILTSYLNIDMIASIYYSMIALLVDIFVIFRKIKIHFTMSRNDVCDNIFESKS